MSRQRAWRLLPAVLLLVSISACSPPPPPTAETERLEEWLLTAEDVGIGLSEQSRGSAGVEGGRLCPDAAFEIEDHGVVRVELTQGAGRDLVRCDPDAILYRCSGPAFGRRRAQSIRPTRCRSSRSACLSSPVSGTIE